jgi:pimeloyl-ACP methyl ester carboxylesterase
VAAAAAGFVVGSQLLIVAGAMVGAAGLILTQVMCTGMNRSLVSVLFGGALGGSAPVGGGGDEAGYSRIVSCSAEECAMALENAERVGGLVIMNTGLFSGRVSKGFMAWREFAEKNPDLPVGIVAQGGTATELPAAVVAAYEAPFPNPESKAGAATFPLLVPIDDGDPAAAKMGEVAAELRSWDKPCLVAFSDSDPVFPFPKAGEMFTEAIPTAGEQVKIEGAAHFLQEDRGEKIAEEVLSFLGRS